MTSALSNVLLADAGEFVTVLIFLVLAGLSALGKWASAQQQKKQQEEALRRRAHRKALEERQREEGASEEAAGSGTAKRVSPFAAISRRTEAAEDAQQREPAGRAIRRTYRREAEPAAPRPQPSQQPQRPVRPQPRRRAAEARAAEERALRVADELRQEKERLQREKSRLEQRLAEYQPPEADDSTIARRLVSVRPTVGLSEDVATGQAEASIRVDLSDPAAARNAVIFSEILGRPKALSTGGEMWDV